MLNLKLYKYRIIIFFFLFIKGSSFVVSQNDTILSSQKKISSFQLFSLRNSYSLFSEYATFPDSVSASFLHKKDTNSHNRRKNPNSKNKIESPVEYQSQDSISFDMKNKKTYLYKKGEIDYQEIKLRSDFISVDFDKRELFAEGIKDTLGNLHGEPIFNEGESEYNAKTIRYNFDTKKGIITNIVTKEGEGYIHGDKVKKENDSIMYLESGRFTTCDLEHPHYAIEFSKSKLITGDKIVTATSYISIENVPTPLIIPFGVFPFSQKRSSGILIPTYDWYQNKGYGLEGLGYYWAINDYVDLTVRTNIYTSTTWSVSALTQYKKRYKYSGDFNIFTEQINTGIRGTSNYNNLLNYNIRWTHQQDPKASKNSLFTARVDYQNKTYSKWTSNISDYLSNEASSSISYRTKLGRKFNLTTALTQRYNTSQHLMTFELPGMSLSSEVFYPFQKKDHSGKTKWYESISIQYFGKGNNSLTAPDSSFFKKESLKKLQSYISHNIPIKQNLKILKHFNLGNTIDYNEYWQPFSIQKNWDTDSSRVNVDTLYGFKTYRTLSFETDLSTIIYGTFTFKNKYVKAVRHQMDPSISFKYTPDFSSPSFGFYKSYQDTNGKQIYYSVFEHNVKTGPIKGQSSVLRFNLNNSLEMKIRNKKDTITGTKKIRLIDLLSFSMDYDLAKDSFNLSDLVIHGYSTVFKFIHIGYQSRFTPYVIDTNGKPVNEFLWNKEKKLFKKQNANWTFKLNLSFNPDMFKKENSNTTENEKSNASPFPSLSPFNDPYQQLGTHVDFSVPWNISIDYRIEFDKNYRANQQNYHDTVKQYLNFRIDFSLTPKWKIILNSGWDFGVKQVTLPEIKLYRDLHCWEMSFDWIPIGVQKKWGFTIALKATMLKDLKYEMKHNQRDAVNF